MDCVFAAQSSDLHACQLANMNLIHDINSISNNTLWEQVGGFMTKSRIKGKIVFSREHG